MRRTSQLLRFVPALLWAGVIFWLSAQSDPPGPSVPVIGVDKLAHAGVYGVLALLLLFADRGRRPLLWVAVAIAYGVTDEAHQYLVPGRETDGLDLLANAAGAILSVALWWRWGLPSPSNVAAPARVQSDGVGGLPLRDRD